MKKADMDRLLPGGHFAQGITLPPASTIVGEEVREEELLAVYYSHPAVLAAFGWRLAPPQPGGHSIASFDESLLAQVSARKPFWRRAE